MNCRYRKLVLATFGAQWLSNVAALGRAVHYARAAQRDERKRFHYAAAMEWRLAAELFDVGAPVAEYCWLQWERIMRLPRRFSAPITDSAVVPASMNDQISLTTAA